MIDVSFACTTIAKGYDNKICFIRNYVENYITLLYINMYAIINCSLQSVIYVFRTWSCWLLFHITR